MLELFVNKVCVRLKGREVITSGAHNIFPCRFEFSSDWEGASRTAVFRAGGVERAVLLDENNQCQIPYEVLETPNCDVYAGAYGTRNGEKVIPTVWVKIGHISPGVRPAEAAVGPTPGLYEQILSEAQEAKEIAQSVREDADNGLLPGALPDGGTKGQVLTKRSDADGDAGWEDPKEGETAVSPTAKVVQTADGAEITMTDVNGTTTATVKNGKDGEKGEKGDPGDDGSMSPTAANLLITILQNAVFTTNQTANITALREALASGGNTGGEGTPGVPEADDITVSDGVMTIATVGSAVSVSDGVMTIA